jgi:16S rRNA processing protein RimM
MIPANCILLGKITKVHGFEGAVTVKIQLNLPEDIPAGEPVFLEIEGRPVPFFIEENFSSRPGLLVIKFENYDNSEKVKEFVGCNVFITSLSAPGETEEDLGIIDGYEVISDTGEIVGKISEIIRNPRQILLEVISVNNRKIFIPLHEDLIREINKKLQTITMVIPAGLDEIN